MMAKEVRSSDSGVAEDWPSAQAVLEELAHTCCCGCTATGRTCAQELSRLRSLVPWRQEAGDSTPDWTRRLTTYAPLVHGALDGAGLPDQAKDVNGLLSWDDEAVAAQVARCILERGSVQREGGGQRAGAGRAAHPAGDAVAPEDASSPGAGAASRRDVPLMLKRFVARVLLQVVLPLAINYLYSSS